jgi:hypothetical protein
MLVVAPLQIDCDDGVADPTGRGLTVTSTVKAVPAHPFAVGVTVYLTIPAVVPVLVSVCDIDVPEPPLNPVTAAPDNCAAVHVKLVPATVEFKAMFVDDALQMVCALADPTGWGLTVTTTVSGVPTHPLAEGVIVYVAVPGVVPVAVSVCAIVAVEPFAAPVKPDCATVQLYVVPTTLELSGIEVALPEQIVCDDGVAVTTGVGFTVTSTVKAVPAHPFAVGVTVYLTTPAVVPLLVNVCEIVPPEPSAKPLMVPPDCCAAVQE